MTQESKTHKLLAAGSATLIAEPALAFAHQGGLGVILGLAAGAVAWGIVDDLEKRKESQEPLLASSSGEHTALVQQQDLHLDKAKHGLYRLFVGKSVREAGQLQNDVPAPLEEFVDPDEMEYVVNDAAALVYGRPISLLESGGLPLTPQFRPHPHSMVCQNMAFFGQRRYGKSNALSLLIRALATCGPRQQGFPLFLFDTENEYEELARAQWMPRGTLAGAPESRADVPEGIRFCALERKTARRFAHWCLDNTIQVVVNMQSWSEVEAAEILCEMIAGMEEWEQVRDPDGERIPFFCIIDEITKYVPQYQGENPLPAETKKRVEKAIFDVAVRRGGKRGFGMILAGQKMTEVEKRALQHSWLFVFHQENEGDLKKFNDTYKLEPESVLSLQVGECFVICPQAPKGVFVSWPRSVIPLGGRSPSMDDLARHQGTIGRSVSQAL